MMAVSPEYRSENQRDFRAPPPSPIAFGRRSSVANDAALTDFLHTSLRVPDLILPDHSVFPHQRSAPAAPPEIDLRSLASPESDSLSRVLESIAAVGCFQLINHGIDPEMFRSASASSAGLFAVTPEKKALAKRSPEYPYGYAEVGFGDDNGDGGGVGEEFVWCRDGSLMSEMEGIWARGYPDFSEKMECLAAAMEAVAGKMMAALREDGRAKGKEFQFDGGAGRSMICCYVRKQRRGISRDAWARSVRYEVMRRMLIRGVDLPHALCLHVCDDGSPEFHVYSKKGSLAFCPRRDAIVVTAGDQLQAWSGGNCCKHVVLGRPAYEVDEDEGRVSMAFLCSPPTLIITNACIQQDAKENTISLGLQAVFVVLTVLVYHFLLYIY